MAGTRLTIHLDVEGEADSPRGRVRNDYTGATKRFLGWLGLVSAVDALITGLPPTASSEARQAGAPTEGREGSPWPEDELGDPRS